MDNIRIDLVGTSQTTYANQSYKAISQTSLNFANRDQMFKCSKHLVKLVIV
jgi:hypothetical protein